MTEYEVWIKLLARCEGGELLKNFYDGVLLEVLLDGDVGLLSVNHFLFQLQFLKEFLTVHSDSILLWICALIHHLVDLVLFIHCAALVF